MKAGLKISVSFISWVLNHLSWSIANHFPTPSWIWKSGLFAPLWPLSVLSCNKTYPFGYTVSSVVGCLLKSCPQKLEPGTGFLILPHQTQLEHKALNIRVPRGLQKCGPWVKPPCSPCVYGRKRKGHLWEVQEASVEVCLDIPRSCFGGLRHHSPSRFHM